MSFKSMDIEKFLNENKDNILRFDLNDTSFTIHIKEKGKIEFDTGSPFINFNTEYITNTFYYGKKDNNSPPQKHLKEQLKETVIKTRNSTEELNKAIYEMEID